MERTKYNKSDEWEVEESENPVRAHTQHVSVVGSLQQEVQVSVAVGKRAEKVLSLQSPFEPLTNLEMDEKNGRAEGWNMK